MFKKILNEMGTTKLCANTQVNPQTADDNDTIQYTDDPSDVLQKAEDAIQAANDAIRIAREKMKADEDDEVEFPPGDDSIGENQQNQQTPTEQEQRGTTRTSVSDHQRDRTSTRTMRQSPSTKDENRRRPRDTQTENTAIVSSLGAGLGGVNLAKKLRLERLKENYRNIGQPDPKPRPGDIKRTVSDREAANDRLKQRRDMEDRRQQRRDGRRAGDSGLGDPMR